MKSLVFLSFLIPLAVGAQQVPQERTVPLEEQIQQEVAVSPIHLGPFYLLPRFALDNAGYNSNIFGTPEPTVSDWTATVGAGVHFVLPFGRKMYLRGDAFPQYYWYAHHVDQRSLGGLYNISWLAFFNRMSAEADGAYSEVVKSFSSENQAFVRQTFVDGAALAEVRFSEKWSLFAGGEGHRVRSSDIGTAVTTASQLDRNSYAARVGIRYHWTSFFDVVGEIEGTQADFVETPLQHDNRSIAYLLGVHYDQPRFFVNLSGGYRDARPNNDSTFEPFTTFTGAYFVSYYLVGPFELQVYGHRLPDYSLTKENAYYIETRNSVGLTIHVGRRLDIRGYGQYGTNDYPVPASTGTEFVNRTDHFSIVGGGLAAFVFRNATVRADVNREIISSNFPGVARSIFRFTTSLSFEARPTR
jgi:hypothetical protein